MGNTLPKNPTKEDYLTYAAKASPERAIEIYQNLARELRIEKNWEEAVKILLLCVKLQNADERSKTLVDIANIYAKLNSPEKYISHLQEAIDIFIPSGNFSSGGKYCVLIAEEYEKNLDYKKAVEYYTKAVDYYESADMESNRTRYSIKLATLSAFDPSTLDGSISMFEKIADTSSKNKLSIYSVPRYLLNAGLCRILADDIDTVKKNIENYCVVYPIFSNSRESSFLSMISDAVDKKDVNAFTSVIIDYNTLCEIDNWTSNILLKIKTSISENNLC